MIFFGERKKLADQYQKFAEDNGVKDCALSVITYLEGEGLLRGKAHFETWWETEEDELGEHHTPHWRCSSCHTEYDPHNARTMNYCSVCGAKFEKKEEK